jgi:hypothetical protein
MIPQTQKSVVGLSDRLAMPERIMRHHKAERLTADGTRQVPHAVDMNTEYDSDFAEDDIWFE